jgi:hypothetical protein
MFLVIKASKSPSNTNLRFVLAILVPIGRPSRRILSFWVPSDYSSYDYQDAINL